MLLDLRLPDMSGFDVCRALRAASIVPIIIITAQTDTYDMVAGLEAGADDYVTKPVVPEGAGGPHPGPAAPGAAAGVVDGAAGRPASATSSCAASRASCSRPARS